MALSQQFLQQIAAESALYQGALVLIVALLLARLAPLPKALSPLSWLSQLALSLSAKVNHNSRAPSQQITAGVLAIMLLVMPFWLICVFLLQLAAYPWFFECLILYFCLSDEQFNRIAKRVQLALKAQNKASARRLLKPWQQRDLDALSEIGLSKATIEQLATTPIYGTVATVLFFILGGAPLVLLASMIKQLESCWPALHPRYTHFGKPVYLLCYLIYFLPSLAWNITLAIQGGPQTLLTLLRPPLSRQAVNHQLPTLAVAAKALNIELGGPVKFSLPAHIQMDGMRVEVDKVGSPNKPVAKDIQAARKLMATGQGIWLAGVLLLPCIWALLRYLQAGG
ncbi:cobalamin biosynthesis protein [Shewanella sp. AS1]|uniref:cobalamin biosynthesis protein CobD/CbiB n=1 Tax=Shewanella sp. AS1 TaxID=2907626 RepID=UPI001F306668|nr:cobalamin biosynthesis protein [Shewanella sp. AS1]MCE9677940.1 cobalamin biosynthesis protein [Shewanella sp. AS1]